MSAKRFVLAYMRYFGYLITIFVWADGRKYKFVEDTLYKGVNVIRCGQNNYLRYILSIKEFMFHFLNSKYYLIINIIV